MSTIWNNVALGDFCSITSGNSINESEKNSLYKGCPDGLPYIATKDVSFEGLIDYANGVRIPPVKFSAFKLAPAGSVLVCAEGGSAGRKVGHLNQDVHFVNKLFCINPDKMLDKRFLYYFFISREFQNQFRRLTTGLIGGVSLNKFKSIMLPIPPMTEQKRIVEILDGAFDGIAKATANAQRNLANAQGLFFSSLAKVFEREDMKPDVLISEACEEIVDCLNRTAPKVERETPFLMLRTTNIRNGKVSLDSVNFVDEETYKIWTRRQIPQAGDVILTREAPLGEVGMIEGSEKVFLGQRLVSYRANEKKLNPRFLLYCLRSKPLQDQIRRLASGATVQHMRVPDSKALLIPLPSLSKQQTCVKHLDYITAQSENLKTAYTRKIANLEKLKKSLLHKAFTGQLTFSSVVPAVQKLESPMTANAKLTAQVIVLAHYRHAAAQRDKTFGHVKAQKILHLAESCANIPLARSPIKDAAGPNDFAHMLRAEEWAESNGFFKFNQRDSGYSFQKLKGYNQLLSEAQERLKPFKQKLDKILGLLVSMNTQEAEVFATVHAAWNNLIIDRKPITDEAIIKEARDNWHPDKLNIPKAKFLKAILLIRKENLVPDGSAKPVRLQQEKLF